MAWNNHILTTGGMDGQIISYNIAETLTEVIHEVCGLKWSASGQQLASGGNDNLIQKWDRSTALSGLCSVVEQE